MMSYILVDFQKTKRSDEHHNIFNNNYQDSDYLQLQPIANTPNQVTHLWDYATYSTHNQEECTNW